MDRMALATTNLASLLGFCAYAASSEIQCRVTVHWQVTLVSDTAFSSFFSLSWEEVLAVALSSLALIFPSSSSSFSRSCSKVWAQLSHSGIQKRIGLAKDHTQFIVNCMSQRQTSGLLVNSPWQCSSVFVSPGSRVFLQTGETVKKKRTFKWNLRWCIGI